MSKAQQQCRIFVSVPPCGAKCHSLMLRLKVKEKCVSRSFSAQTCFVELRGVACKVPIRDGSCVVV